MLVALLYAGVGLFAVAYAETQVVNAASQEKPPTVLVIKQFNQNAPLLIFKDGFPQGDYLIPQDSTVQIMDIVKNYGIDPDGCDQAIQSPDVWGDYIVTCQ